MPTEYKEKRIRNTITRYQNDIKAIRAKADEQGKEMMRLRDQRAKDMKAIEALHALNENLLQEWAKISGKIEALEEILNEED